MENKGLFELGRLAYNGNSLAMAEIIRRKEDKLKRYSKGNKDMYQYLVLKLIEKIYKCKFFRNF